jgi:hypothetical protein
MVETNMVPAVGDKDGGGDRRLRVLTPPPREPIALVPVYPPPPKPSEA